MKNQVYGFECTPPPSVKALRGRRLVCQSGAFAVELGLVAILFFTLLFSIMEVSRALYMWNALQEVTRRAARAASVTDFSDAEAMAKLQRNAIFRTSSGTLALGAPVTEKHVRIDYLSIQSVSNNQMKKVQIASSAMPACPARNLVTCTAKTGDEACIRLVRARICEPDGDECTPVPYKSLFPLIKLPMNLPKAETIVQAESLGYVPGMALCK